MTSDSLSYGIWYAYTQLMDNSERKQMLGKAVAEARLKMDFLQRDLAWAIGTDQSYVWEIESGRVGDGFDRLCGIADVLGIQVRT